MVISVLVLTFGLPLWHPEQNNNPPPSKLFLIDILLNDHLRTIGRPHINTGDDIGQEGDWGGTI